MEKKFTKNTFKKIGRILLCVLILILIVLYLYFNILNVDSDIEVLSKYGSRGKEVTTIQEKLRRWGYYSGNVDGIYGLETQKAVKYFQEKNGLKVDGIVGDETLKALGIQSTGDSNSQTGSVVNSNDLNLLSRLIYGEARGEVYEGQVAVGAVVLNRVRSSLFPNSIAGVIYQTGAFDAVKDGQINLEPDQTSKKAAQDALNGWDPSYGAIYYFNPATATNDWIWSRPETITIGRHRFAK